MFSEVGSSKADTLVKVVLVFFISLLSFSVGTFVGKQVSDSDHRRMALEGENKSERGVASTEGSVKPEGAADAKTEGETGGKISDKEVESLTEEFVNKEKANEGSAATMAKTEEHAPEGETAATEKTDKAAGEKTEPSGYKTYSRGKMADEAKAGAKGHMHGKMETEDTAETANDEHGKLAAIADKVAKGEAPSDGKGEERKPSSVLPSVASSAIGKYTVQVGSYAEENEAKSHAAELKGKGWNSFYFAANVDGRTWYRVSVGLFNNIKSANEFRGQFMKDANTKSAIVQKIVQ